VKAYIHKHERPRIAVGPVDGLGVGDGLKELVTLWYREFLDGCGVAWREYQICGVLFTERRPPIGNYDAAGVFAIDECTEGARSRWLWDDARQCFRVWLASLAVVGCYRARDGITGAEW
jgi:hypothetical protein